jgi:sensor histidine kinase YesM
MIVIDSSDDDADVDDDTRSPSAKVVIQRTFAGWLGDIFSALLIALFAYLVAAKIMVRKTAEANAKLHVADAKVRSAEDNAEREAVERQLMQARLKLLQAQVEPHFLFNTLAAVDYLIETDPPRASVMQKTLIAYLRASLPQMRQESSTLGRELQLIRAYLALLKMRIEERLEFDIEVSPELEGAVFPPMVLQTLVENAIQHGIEPKPGGGRISVRALHEGGNLRVDVVDTGVGLPSNYNGGNPQPSANGGSGLGLDNIRNRLAVLYPHTSRIELSSGYGGGTMVRLTIPYQNTHAADAGTTP